MKSTNQYTVLKEKYTGCYYVYYCGEPLCKLYDKEELLAFKDAINDIIQDEEYADMFDEGQCDGCTI